MLFQKNQMRSPRPLVHPHLKHCRCHLSLKKFFSHNRKQKFLSSWLPTLFLLFWCREGFWEIASKGLLKARLLPDMLAYFVTGTVSCSSLYIKPVTQSPSLYSCLINATECWLNDYSYNETGKPKRSSQCLDKNDVWIGKMPFSPKQYPCFCVSFGDKRLFTIWIPFPYSGKSNCLCWTESSLHENPFDLVQIRLEIRILQSSWRLCILAVEHHLPLHTLTTRTW